MRVPWRRRPVPAQRTPGGPPARPAGEVHGRELLSWIEQVVGYRPRGQLFVTSLDGVARGAMPGILMDLPDEQDVEAIVRASMTVVMRLQEQGLRSAVAVVHGPAGPDGDRMPGMNVAGTLAMVLERSGLALADAYYVGPERFRAYCFPDCCPRHGFPVGLLDGTALAAALGQEHPAPAPAEDDARPELAPRPGDPVVGAALLAPAREQLGALEPALLASWLGLLDGGTPADALGAGQVAVLAAALERDVVRRRLLRAVVEEGPQAPDAAALLAHDVPLDVLARHRSPAGPRCARAEELVRLVVRATAGTPAQPGALTALGWLLWHRGASALAAVALTAGVERFGDDAGLRELHHLVAVRGEPAPWTVAAPA